VRDLSPLSLDPDAVLVDTDGKSIGSVVDEIAEIVLGRWNSSATVLSEGQDG
jgi:cytidylate kinase